MRPSVDIACDVFEGDETEATLEYPDAGFNVHLHRFFATELQNLSVELYCAIGYALSLAQNPDQVRALFDRAEYHCEGCVGDIRSTIHKRRKGPKRSS